jgi:hypothetical protein
MAKKTSKKLSKSKSKKKHAVKVKLNKDTPYEIEWLFVPKTPTGKFSAFGEWLIGTAKSVWNKITGK